MTFLRLGIVAMALASAAATPGYNWVDQRGKVHYAARATRMQKIRAEIAANCR